MVFSDLASAYIDGVALLEFHHIQINKTYILTTKQANHKGFFNKSKSSMPIFFSNNSEFHNMLFQKKNSRVTIIRNQDLVFSFLELVT